MIILWFRLRNRLLDSYQTSSLPLSYLKNQPHPFSEEQKWCFLGVRVMVLALQVWKGGFLNSNKSEGKWFFQL